MKKRLLSVLLVICMVLTLMPISAFAAADTVATGDITVGVDGEGVLSGGVMVELADGIKFVATADKTSFTVTVGDVEVEVAEALFEDADGKTAEDGAGEFVKADLFLAAHEVTTVTEDSEVVITIAKAAVEPEASDDITVNTAAVTITVSDGEEPPEDGIATGSITVDPNTVTAQVSKDTTEYTVTLGGKLAAPETGTSADVKLTFAVTADGNTSNVDKTITLTYVAADEEEGTEASWTLPTEIEVNSDYTVKVAGTVAVDTEGGGDETTGVKVSGTVSAGDTGLASVANITVTLTGTDPEVAAVTAKTGADGKYEFANVAAGTYKITIAAGTGYKAAELLNVTVAKADVTEQDITLVAPTYTVSGTVSKGTTAVTDVSGLSVVLCTKNEEGAYVVVDGLEAATTNAEGKFEITGIPAGATKYYAVVKAADASALYVESPSSEITVSANVTNANITLLPAKVTLTLSSSPSNGGSISAQVDGKAAGKEVIKGKKVEITVSYASTEWTCKTFKVDGADASASLVEDVYTIDAITADTTVAVEFEKKAYDVSAAKFVGETETDVGDVTLLDATGTVITKASAGDTVKVKAVGGEVTDGEGNETTYIVSGVKAVEDMGDDYDEENGPTPGEVENVTLVDGYYTFTMPSFNVTVLVSFTALEVTPGDTQADEYTGDDADKVNAAMNNVTADAPENESGEKAPLSSYIDADREASAAVLEAIEGLD